MVPIQSSHTSPSKCMLLTLRNLMSYSLLTPWFYSFNYLPLVMSFCGISYLYSLGCLSYGDVICGTIIVYLITCTTGGTALTIVGTTNGSTLPSSFFVRSNLCSCIPSSLLNLRFLLLQL